MRALANAVMAGSCMVLVAFLLAFNAYVFAFNDSNHTGFPLEVVKWLFAGCAAGTAVLAPAALR